MAAPFRICQSLGWKGPGGRFDILPLVLQANGQQEPEYFDIPKELALQVDLCHPEYDWFADLGLKWYAVPGVANLLLDVGGLEFPACPFNGWYMSSEIGCRNLCDSNRYNLLETFAIKMGLKTNSNATLWKDWAMLEANCAVLHSFQKAGVTITDHHSASESFMVHMEKEQRIRGGCPGDWVWIVPPISGNLCSVFHQEMMNYIMKPGFVYREYVSKIQKRRLKSESSASPITFRALARMVRYATSNMRVALYKRFKATILYATIPVFIRKASKFHMPANKTDPMILIGPGAGIAPYRSFWQQRQFDLVGNQFPGTTQEKDKLGDISLFFGCRGANLDDIYKTETDKLKNEGALSSVWTAYSRDPNEPKTYVQDLLRKNSQWVYNTLSSFRGHVYVCGDVTMATDVAKVIESVGADHGDMSLCEAKSWISSFKDENRYHEDIFGVTLRTTEVVERRRSVVQTQEKSQ